MSAYYQQPVYPPQPNMGAAPPQQPVPQPIPQAAPQQVQVQVAGSNQPLLVQNGAMP
eukprot:CAMPEP_0170485690 /NCGR_PEP_ID=MMETSP0208-20121228/4892_1 /TAXON_ID=197538 /ORGANISM="Strombidium inclinatum, Strain S3" /LENGTH=56 /DNA_ID=CAMNT_0010759403 /DNA_START=123 /DNA_END=293 /DNA_ORIENTATION=-